MVKDKSGKVKTSLLLILIILGFVGIIMVGIFVYGANLVDQTFSNIDISIGTQNFTEVYDETLGQGVNSFLNSADDYGILLLFGMVLLMAITGYSFKERQKVWIALEFIILIVSFVFASTIQRAYNTVINSSTELLDIYSITLINSSKFILNLHIIVPIVWGLMIILTYGLFRRRDREASIGGDLGF